MCRMATIKTVDIWANAANRISPIRKTKYARIHVLTSLFGMDVISRLIAMMGFHSKCNPNKGNKTIPPDGSPKLAFTRDNAAEHASHHHMSSSASRLGSSNWCS